MNRRAFLVAGAATAASAGCLARLGLVDRLTVVEKSVRGVDAGEERSLATRLAAGADGRPAYDGEIDEILADHVGPEDPLVLGTDAIEALEAAFDEVRYAFRGCEGAQTGCLEATVFPDDFDAFEVGDVVDVRVSGDGAGVVSVRERRSDRE